MTNYLEVYSIFKKANSKGTKPNRHSRFRTPTVDYCSLEDRKMLAVATLTPTSLIIDGTDGVDRVFVSDINATEIRVSLNGSVETFQQSDVNLIEFNGLGGNDVFDASASSVEVIASGGEGNDRLVGGLGSDQLSGEGGDDVLLGGGAADELSGGAGNDVLDGGSGDDTAVGGIGNDTLRGGDNEDTLRGDAGDDVISGGSGDDTLSGGNGNDTLVGDAGNDDLIGGFGDDLLAGSDGDDGLFGGNGADRLFGQNGEDRLNGNGDDDVVNGGAGADIAQGGNGNDRVSGGADDDRVLGNAGDDIVDGNGGNDLVFGSVGDDILRGGDGDDTIGGNDGDDTIDGGQGDDLVFGGNGFDAIRGGAGEDSLFGQAGADSILGGSGDDRVVGNGGNDFLDGQNGNDFINGGFGADRLFGGNGNDDLRGGVGADGLFGGVGGEDRLSGDAGSDRLISVGSENIVNLAFEDSQVEFRNGSGAWTNREIQVIDTGLHLLQRRIGNNRLASDPQLAEPIVFIKENTIAPGPSLVETQVVDSERQYLVGDWNEFDFESNQDRTAAVPRGIAVAWASGDAIGAVLPNLEQTFNRFTQISGWQTTNGGDFFRASEDGQFFYRQDAVFADETGQINPTQDWASAWQFFFSPPEVVGPEVEEPTVGEPEEPNLLTGDRITINSFLDVGVTQRLTNFEFVVEDAGAVTILTGIEGSASTDSDFDTEIFLFARNNDGTLGALLAQDDDAGGGLDSLVSLSLPVGEYALVVGDFPISEFEARSGFGVGSGGQFQITFIGTDGVGPLPNGPIGADNTTVTPPPTAPPELPVGEDPQFLAKLAVLDSLFTGLEVF